MRTERRARLTAASERSQRALNQRMPSQPASPTASNTAERGSGTAGVTTRTLSMSVNNRAPSFGSDEDDAFVSE